MTATYLERMHAEMVDGGRDPALRVCPPISIDSATWVEFWRPSARSRGAIRVEYHYPGREPQRGRTYLTRSATFADVRRALHGALGERGAYFDIEGVIAEYERRTTPA